MPGETETEISRRNALVDSYWGLVRKAEDAGFNPEAHDYPRKYINGLKAIYPIEQMKGTELYQRLLGGSETPKNFDLPNGELEKFITNIFPKYIDSLKNP